MQAVTGPARGRTISGSLKIVAVDDEPWALRRLEIALRAVPGVTLAGTARDPLDAIALVEAVKPDLLLLDVEMPELDGLALAERIAERGGHTPLIIFATAFERYAIKAFEANAIDYLLKPISQDRLVAAIEKARALAAHGAAAARIAELQAVLAELKSALPVAAREADEREIWVQRGTEHVRLLPEDIDWAESDRDYVHIHVGSQSFLLRTPLGTLHERLGTEQFLRVRRSAIVQLRRISSIRNLGYGNMHAVLASGGQVRIGRTYAKQIRARLRATNGGEPGEG